jgi:hypothetical protein
VTNKKVAYRGVPFENGVDETGEDRILIIPPLPINIVRTSLEEVTAITNPDPIKQVHLQNERVKQVILTAIHRNYPDFSNDQLEEFLTYRNIQLAYQASLGSDTSPDGKTLPAPVRSAGEMVPVETGAIFSGE